MTINKQIVQLSSHFKLPTYRIHTKSKTYRLLTKRCTFRHIQLKHDQVVSRVEATYRETVAILFIPDSNDRPNPSREAPPIDFIVGHLIYLRESIGHRTRLIGLATPESRCRPAPARNPSSSTAPTRAVSFLSSITRYLPQIS